MRRKTLHGLRGFKIQQTATWEQEDREHVTAISVVTRLAVESDLSPGWTIYLFTLPAGTKRPLVETV